MTLLICWPQYAVLFLAEEVKLLWSYFAVFINMLAVLFYPIQQAVAIVSGYLSLFGRVPAHGYRLNPQLLLSWPWAPWVPAQLPSTMLLSGVARSRDRAHPHYLPHSHSLFLYCYLLYLELKNMYNFDVSIYVFLQAHIDCHVCVYEYVWVCACVCV